MHFQHLNELYGLFFLPNVNYCSELDYCNSQGQNYERRYMYRVDLDHKDGRSILITYE